jgi:hypothetical protein
VSDADGSNSSNRGGAAAGQMLVGFPRYQKCSIVGLHLTGWSVGHGKEEHLRDLVKLMPLLVKLKDANNSFCAVMSKPVDEHKGTSSI